MLDSKPNMEEFTFVIIVNAIILYGLYCMF